MTATILRGDARNLPLPDDSVDLIVRISPDTPVQPRTIANGGA